MFTKEQIIEENKQHRLDIAMLSTKVIEEICDRVRNHDMDKNNPINAEILANALNNKQWEEWNTIHLLEQKHHSEWIQNHLYKQGANLFDYLEMCIDGCCANLRRTGNTSDYESQVNFFERKGFNPEMAIILANTFMIMQEWFIKIKNEEEK